MHRHAGAGRPRGKYPRSLAFDPAGEFLYCCNQRVGNPSCVVFLDLN
jgi:DNA-binding beta-propeller fold protein YncE